MKIICAPEAEMLIVAQSSRNKRKSLANFVPRIGLTTVDYARLEEIDNFYLECQNFRDYYRDPYNKLARPTAFKKHYGKCGKHFQDKTTAKLLLSHSSVREKQPILYPIHYRKDIIPNGVMDLAGQYNSDPCYKYKH